MILDKTVKIKITNRNISKYRELGYLPKSGTELEVLIHEAGGKTRIHCKCDDCDIKYYTVNAYLNDINSKYCQVCAKSYYTAKNLKFWTSEKGLKTRKENGLKISKAKKGKPGKNFGEKNGMWNPNKTEYQKYQYKVIRYTRKNFKAEIKALDNFSKRGMAGVPGAYQIDHKISILYGFENNIDPEIIGHIENLEMIPWENNRAKSAQNSISLAKLNELITKYKETQ